MPRKHHRFRLLFDEGLPVPTYFPLLNNLHNIKHVVRDFKCSGIPDTEVYQLAVFEKRLIVTFNKKHFKKMVEHSKDTGIIARAIASKRG